MEIFAIHTDKIIPTVTTTGNAHAGLTDIQEKEQSQKQADGRPGCLDSSECSSAVDFYCLMSKLRCPFPTIAVYILCEISAADIHLTEAA